VTHVSADGHATASSADEASARTCQVPPASVVLTILAFWNCDEPTATHTDGVGHATALRVAAPGIARAADQRTPADEVCRTAARCPVVVATEPTASHDVTVTQAVAETPMSPSPTRWASSVTVPAVRVKICAWRPVP